MGVAGVASATSDADSIEKRRPARFVNGAQALVQLALAQRARDAAGGHATAGFISGYRGSPLGSLDMELWRAKAELENSDVTFSPGLNEDLAATAVWGSQQVGLLEGARHDGVFGMWYGKNPGLDRSADAIKHANFAGVAPLGGVLAVVGDDHAAKSSSIPHQSEQLFAHLAVPFLYPSSVQEYVEYGLVGWAMSRFAGCWVGLKAAGEIVDSATTIKGDWSDHHIEIPSDTAMTRGITWDLAKDRFEPRQFGERLPAALRFAVANGLDRRSHGSASARIGIVASGKAYGDVVEAMQLLGIDAKAADALGLTVYKVAMPWPLEPSGIRTFAKGLERLVVVEEKRAFLEEQIAGILYASEDRPRLLGKRDERGDELFPETGVLNATEVAAGLARCLDLVFRRPSVSIIKINSAATRVPAFCAGCPHSTSTVIPDGSHAHGGIGCHAMALWMPQSRVLAKTHMGGEGANWIAHSQFTDTKHIFQNMGDGTYLHSGSLVVRAALAAGTNITFKILVNGAVAMTGGQPLEGFGELETVGLVERITAQLAAEGVSRIEVVSENPRRHQRRRLPRGVRVHHRDRLDELQRELRELSGVTAIVYDQVCAAEARRLRKRGLLETPTRRVVIHPEVCEGCGDCGVQSNCIAIEPLETNLGRKRTIDQDACNIDLSCLKGYCPSFATVEGASLRAPIAADHALDLESFIIPDPVPAATGASWNVLIVGVGGTGVLTVGAILGSAAHLDGKKATVLNETGLAQKNGPVTSHVRIAELGAEFGAVRIAEGSADLLLGCDAVVASSNDVRGLLSRRTRAVANTRILPTAAFTTEPDLDLSIDTYLGDLRRSIGRRAVDAVDASSLVTRLLGKPLASNVLLLGYAYQRGLIPLSRASLHRAIDLSGADARSNIDAFEYGRLAAHQPDVCARALGGSAEFEAAPEDLEGIIHDRKRRLSAYQDDRYAERFEDLVRKVESAEKQLVQGSDLAEAVAISYSKLMAYKDEYEVARLWADDESRRRLLAPFEPGARLRIQLAPQILWPRDKRTNRARKISFGPWVIVLFKVGARFKFLRGTVFDVFGYAKHRRDERRAIAAYRETVDFLLENITSENHRLAVDIARLGGQVRGFGVVKEAAASSVGSSQAELLSRFSPSPSASAEGRVAARHDEEERVR